MNSETEQSAVTPYEIISWTFLVVAMLTKASYYPDAFTKEYGIEKELPEDFAVALSVDQLIWLLKTLFSQECPPEVMQAILSNIYTMSISGRKIGEQKATYRIWNRGEIRGLDF